MAYRSIEFGKAFCEALGISPNGVIAIRLSATPRDAVKVELDILPDELQLQPVLDGVVAAMMELRIMQEGVSVARFVRTRELEEIPEIEDFADAEEMNADGYLTSDGKIYLRAHNIDEMEQP